MKRQLNLLLLALSLTIPLAACGTPDDGFNDPVTEIFEAPPIEEPAMEPTTGDAPDEEPAAPEEDMPEQVDLPGPIAVPYEHPFIGQTSLDGKYILFNSFTPDPINDPDNSTTPHVALYNTRSGEVTLISATADGTPADFWSVEESMSADGRYIIFWSYAANLDDEPEQRDCTQQAPSCGDLYAYEVETGRLDRLALEAGYGIGLTNDTDISVGGRYMTFASNVSDAYPGGWLYDSEVDELVQISETAIAVRVSDDGRTVAYVNDIEDNGIFVLDRITEEVTQLGSPQQSETLMDGMIAFNEGASPAIEMTPDARYVAYVSTREGIVDGDFTECGTFFGAVYPACQHVYVHDLETGEVELISASNDGTPGNQVSDLINITADGRFVLFRSQASNLTPAGGMPEENPFISALYLRDRESGRTYLVSRGPDGHPVNGWGYLTTDGTQVIFNMGDNVFAQNTGHFVLNISDLIEQRWPPS